MSKRLLSMIVLMGVMVSLLVVGTVAAGGFKGPKITGGGVTVNDNAFGVDSGVTGVAHGGITARATGDITDPTKRGPEAIAAYTARGQFEGRSEFSGTLDGAPIEALTRVHGRVVCIAELDDDVWEIRIQVTQSSFEGTIDLGAGPVPVGTVGIDPPAVGTYGSIFVQDNGRGRFDMADENLKLGVDGDDRCGLDLSFGLEASLGGNITVRS